MSRQNLTYNLIFSGVITFLLSLSPVLLLIDHHQWPDIVDKCLLIFTTFIITSVNLKFQNQFHEKSFSSLKFACYVILMNLLLFGLNLLIRIPFWTYIQPDGPPIFIKLSIDIVRSLIIIIATYFIVAFLAKNKLHYNNILKIKDLENESLQLQLKGLTAQLQPHFFFNSLNVLSELIQSDLKKSDEYIQQLSQFFRYVLSNQQNHFVSLKDEIQFINTYIYLLKIRFENAITITYHFDRNLPFLVPSLCSLIVLENIVKHNNISEMEINVSVTDDDNYLKFSNKINRKKSFEVNKLGYGLENINKKCELLLQKSITVNQSDTVFEVAIPLSKSDQA
ncbi:MAG: histidine kinase [Lentimicrobiaceae bacterium]|nr:histidine kinase [Lentimicrobiaceae bacterium]MCO5266655.1 histidine kinase [Lentimicrobium sp.]